MNNINEDIEILEEFIKYFEAEAISRKYRRNISVTVGEDDIQAIENLIKGYREKEESEAYLYDAYQDAGKKMFEYAEALEDSIPKSKVKEKIEELEEEKKCYYSDYKIDELNDKIKVLNELLED